MVEKLQIFSTVMTAIKQRKFKKIFTPLPCRLKVQKVCKIPLTGIFQES